LFAKGLRPNVRLMLAAVFFKGSKEK